MKKLLSILLIVAAGAFSLTSCVRKNFDNPPDMSGYDPQIPVTHTIAQLKAMNGIYLSSTIYDTTLITADVVVSGIVVADDRSGNYYKQIVIQDASGAIAVDIDAYSLYNDYPVGRKVYIKCKGLYLGYNGGTPELGAGINEQKAVKGLNGSQINEHIVKANVGNVVKDTLVSFAAIKAVTDPYSPLINRLVTISDSVEFQDPSYTYTDPSATTNRYITTCASAPSPSTLVVRTSNYANFHAIPLPTGRGIIRGILTIYKTSSTTPQLIIRDTSDVMFYNPNRCGGTVTSNKPIITIDSLRKLYPGSGTYSITAPVSITGVIISDMDNGNISSGNFVIEDGSKKGITMYIPSGASFKLGDSVVVDLTGASMKLYPTTGVGSLELDGLTTSKVSKKASGKTVAPIQTTVANLNSNISKFENVLVKIVNATISGGSTYYFGTGTFTNLSLTDDGGASTINVFTLKAATFGSQAVPSGPKTVVGIAQPFSGKNEIKLRNASDVY